MTQHAISVVPVDAEAVSWLLEQPVNFPSGYRWKCRCGARGSTHDDQQRASEFGSQHLAIEGNYILG